MIFNWNGRFSNPWVTPQQWYTTNGPTGDFETRESASIQTMYHLKIGDKIKIVARVIKGGTVETAAKTVRLKIREVKT